MTTVARWLAVTVLFVGGTFLHGILWTRYQVLSPDYPAWVGRMIATLTGHRGIDDPEGLNFLYVLLISMFHVAVIMLLVYTILRVHRRRMRSSTASST